MLNNYLLNGGKTGISKILELKQVEANLKDKVNPIMMVQTHYKEIDTLGQNYLNYKANYKKIEKIAVGYIIGTPTKIVKQSKRYFTKKEFNFYKEDETFIRQYGFHVNTSAWRNAYNAPVIASIYICSAAVTFI